MLPQNNRCQCLKEIRVGSHLKFSRRGWSEEKCSRNLKHSDHVRVQKSRKRLSMRFLYPDFPEKMQHNEKSPIFS